jgi:hypothetical protein
MRGPHPVDNLATYETTIEMPSKGQRARFWWVDVCDSSKQRCEVATKGNGAESGRLTPCRNARATVKDRPMSS